MLITIIFLIFYALSCSNSVNFSPNNRSQSNAAHEENQQQEGYEDGKSHTVDALASNQNKNFDNSVTNEDLNYDDGFPHSSEENDKDEDGSIIGDQISKTTPENDTLSDLIISPPTKTPVVDQLESDTSSETANNPTDMIEQTQPTPAEETNENSQTQPEMPSDGTPSDQGGEEGSSSTGSDGNMDPNQENPTPPVGEIIDYCQKNEGFVHVAELDFEQANHCAWQKNGNLGRVNQHLQAITRQEVRIELPMGAQICDMSLHSINDDLHYDDVLVLAANEYTLVASTENLLPLLPQEDHLKVWDFSHVKGQELDFNGKPYCQGGDQSTCIFPRHDKKGPLDIQFQSNTMAGIMQKSEDKASINFSLTVTGDNDNGDCFHSDLYMDLTLRYVIIP